MWYQHLTGKGFTETKTGVRIFEHTINVPISANKTEFKLEEKSPVENRHIVGIWLRDYKAGTKGFNAKNLINEAALDSGFITLVEEETNVIKKIPFRNIIRANENGHPYFIQMGELQVNESEIYFSDTSVLVAGEVLELTFDFVKEEKHGRK